MSEATQESTTETATETTDAAAEPAVRLDIQSGRAVVPCGDEITLRKYRCHKTVGAGKITEIISCGPTVDSFKIHTAYDNGRAFVVSRAWFDKFQPEAGGYLVEYGDGYVSYSPAKPFEEGYTEYDDSCLLSFSRALELLKAGKRVARKGWNGKNMWLTLSPGSVVKAENLWSKNNREFAETLPDKQIAVLPYITMKTVNNEVVPWLASQTDLIREDWVVIE